jgi:hypothetical protein
MGSDNGKKVAKKTEWWQSFVFVKASDSAEYNFWCSIGAILIAMCACAEMTSPTQYGKFGGNDGGHINVFRKVFCDIYFCGIRRGCIHWDQSADWMVDHGIAVLDDVCLPIFYQRLLLFLFLFPF